MTDDMQIMGELDHQADFAMPEAPTGGKVYSSDRKVYLRFNDAVQRKAQEIGTPEPDQPEMSEDELRERIERFKNPKTTDTLVQMARTTAPEPVENTSPEAMLLNKNNELNNAYKIYEGYENKPFDGLPEDAIDYALDAMGEFAFNFLGPISFAESGFDAGGTLAQAAHIISSKDPEFAKAFVDFMAEYERLPTWTYEGTGRAFRGIFSDPTTYATAGAGYFLSKAGTQVAATGVKRAIQELAKRPMTLAAAEGAAYAGGGEEALMGVEEASGREISGLEKGLRRGISTTIGAAAGPALMKGAQAGGKVVGEIAEAVGKPTMQAIGNVIEEAGDAAQARIDEPGEQLGMGVDIDPLIAGAGDLVKKLRAEKPAKAQAATPDEVDRITASAKSSEDVERAVQKADEDISRFPVSDGWVRPEVLDPVGKTPSFQKDDKGNISVNYKPVPYAFNKPPQGIDENTHAQNLADKTVNEVIALVARAKAGDKKARKIIQEANWYRAMRTKLRQQYGGLGDVFADLLGATSANTGVQTNYQNALIALKKFTNGDYDAALKEYDAMIKRGESMSAKNIYAADRDPENPFYLIRKDSGKLLGMNSAPAMGALLDLFRAVKAGKSPKTINFTGNLIGYSREATIDVWAARWLRRAAGLPRIATVSEQGVSGAHGAKSTMEAPVVGGEFGFGQKVFKQAANEINQKGILTGYKKSIGQVGDDDLQAVVWFMEKEEWAKNGWTSKAGEGGSFDYEAKFTGQADQKRVKELRSIAVSDVSTKEQKTAARKELKELMAEPSRYQAGVAMERPGQVPTNVEQAQLASEVTAPLKGDENVIAHQAVNTLGEFDNQLERSLNYEVVANKNFDETNTVKALVEAGRKYDQDAVFWSKVVSPDAPNARPGAEVYFMKRQGLDYAQQVTAALKKHGIDGFTFITDARLKDQPRVQASGSEQTGGLTGVRFQYIPEFDPDFTPANAAQRYKEMAKLFRKAMRDIGKLSDISYADVVHYDTKVFKNTDRQGAEWINGGSSYSEILD